MRSENKRMKTQMSRHKYAFMCYRSHLIHSNSKLFQLSTPILQIQHVSGLPQDWETKMDKVHKLSSRVPQYNKVRLQREKIDPGQFISIWHECSVLNSCLLVLVLQISKQYELDFRERGRAGLRIKSSVKNFQLTLEVMQIPLLA